MNIPAVVSVWNAIPGKPWIAALAIVLGWGGSQWLRAERAERELADERAAHAETRERAAAVKTKLDGFAEKAEAERMRSIKADTIAGGIRTRTIRIVERIAAEPVPSDCTEAVVWVMDKLPETTERWRGRL